MNLPLRHTLPCLTLALFCAHLALGQPTTPPENPELHDQSLNLVRKRLNQQAGSTTPIAYPSQGPAWKGVFPQLTRPTETLSHLGYWKNLPSASNALPEGTFLSLRRGELAITSTNQLAFVFHPDTKGSTLPPMILIPGPITNRLQSHLNPDHNPIFYISGQVLTYHRQNFLLPLAFSSYSPPSPTPPTESIEAPPNVPTDTIAETPAEQPVESQQDSPPITADQIIKDLEASTSNKPRALDRNHPPSTPPSQPPSTSNATQSSAPDTQATLQNDHSNQLADSSSRYMASRVGRLVRTNQGWWTFVVDNDTDQTNPPDTNLLIAPCRTLQLLEPQAIQRGESARFKISGRVISAGNTAYLIPTMFSPVRDAEVTPWQ